MKNPNAAAFPAVILICVGAFCAWTAPSFSYPTTYPNTVPMTDSGQLQMQFRSPDNRYNLSMKSDWYIVLLFPAAWLMTKGFEKDKS